MNRSKAIRGISVRCSGTCVPINQRFPAENSTWRCIDHTRCIFYNSTHSPLYYSLYRVDTTITPLTLTISTTTLFPGGLRTLLYFNITPLEASSIALASHCFQDGSTTDLHSLMVASSCTNAAETCAVRIRGETEIGNTTRGGRWKVTGGSFNRAAGRDSRSCKHVPNLTDAEWKRRSYKSSPRCNTCATAVPTLRYQ